MNDFLVEAVCLRHTPQETSDGSDICGGFTSFWLKLYNYISRIESMLQIRLGIEHALMQMVQNFYISLKTFKATFYSSSQLIIFENDE